MTKTPCFGLIAYAKLIDFRITTLNQPEIPQIKRLDDDLGQALDVAVSENALLGACIKVYYQ